MPDFNVMVMKLSNSSVRVSWDRVQYLNRRINYSVITYNAERSTPQHHGTTKALEQIIDGLYLQEYMVFVVAASGKRYGLSFDTFTLGMCVQCFTDETNSHAHLQEIVVSCPTLLMAMLPGLD